MSKTLSKTLKHFNKLVVIPYVIFLKENDSTNLEATIEQNGRKNLSNAIIELQYLLNYMVRLV